MTVISCLTLLSGNIDVLVNNSEEEEAFNDCCRIAGFSNINPHTIQTVPSLFLQWRNLTPQYPKHELYLVWGRI